ncbi:hypothetical protein F5Y11DRAFT_326942 [Daldinia sp. FL1419]|nr:hypothetical protein F5Y11DRAFT_326942 [Daldinia sp. FL1419]
MASPGFIRYTADELLTIYNHHASKTGIVPTIFFSHDVDWCEILAKPVTGCWLAAREREATYSMDGYNEKQNSWVVILELPEGENITIELRQTDTWGNTITLCQKGEPLRIMAEFGGFDLLEGYACSFRNEVNEPTEASTWLDQLERSGVTRYSLDHGRGRRYWIDAMLRQLRGFYKGQPPSLDQAEMTHVWKLGQEVEVPKSHQRIVAGRFLPTKWWTSYHLQHTRPIQPKLPSGPWRFQGDRLDVHSWFKTDEQQSRSAFCPATRV